MLTSAVGNTIFREGVIQSTRVDLLQPQPLLSKRQQTLTPILVLLVYKGYALPVIADLLGISEAEVQTYLSEKADE